eukprot:7971-Heterococcus_DN1.PRE.7
MSACCCDYAIDKAAVDVDLRPLHSSTTLLQRAYTAVLTLLLVAIADSPFDKRTEADEARRAFSLANSDHMTLLKAYDAWQMAKQ